MKPIVAADAPSRDRYAPRMLDAPSCVMSENRLTMPENYEQHRLRELFLSFYFPRGSLPFTIAGT